jgi:hypothetical protein
VGPVTEQVVKGKAADGYVKEIWLMSGWAMAHPDTSVCFAKGVVGRFSFFVLLMYFFTNLLVLESCVDEVRMVFVERFCQLARALG